MTHSMSEVIWKPDIGLKSHPLDWRSLALDPWFTWEKAVHDSTMSIKMYSKFCLKTIRLGYNHWKSKLLKSSLKFHN